MNTNDKPISVKLQEFWKSLPPAAQTSAAYIFGALITMLVAILQGVSWYQAFVVFAVGSLLSIKGIMAVDMTADKHKKLDN